MRKEINSKCGSLSGEKNQKKEYQSKAARQYFTKKASIDRCPENVHSCAQCVRVQKCNSADF